jgi:hypothetical protein
MKVIKSGVSVRFAVIPPLFLAALTAHGASTINGTTWFPVGPAPVTQGQTYTHGLRVDVAGRAGAIAINPNNAQEIYLGTPNGGVWHSTDGGQHWRPRSDQEESLAIGALALDGCSPAGCDTIYAGTGENGIRRDTYRGAGLLIGHMSGGEFSTLSGHRAAPRNSATARSTTSFWIQRSEFTSRCRAARRPRLPNLL